MSYGSWGRPRQPKNTFQSLGAGRVENPCRVLNPKVGVRQPIGITECGWCSLVSLKVQEYKVAVIIFQDTLGIQ